jgi:hypothetical protein
MFCLGANVKFNFSSNFLDNSEAPFEIISELNLGLPDVLQLEDMSSFLASVLPFVLAKNIFLKGFLLFILLVSSYFWSFYWKVLPFQLMDLATLT